jgi:hypothetical protein
MTQESIKVVFLDCDGVISPFGGGGGFFSKEHMLRVKKIIDATGAVIVLSSSWRESDFGRKEVSKQLALNGMATFIDCTPRMPGSRAKEILKWIETSRERYNVINFVALDDINLPAGAPDPKFFGLHAIVTNGTTGLTDADTEKAIELMQDSNNIQ